MLIRNIKLDWADLEKIQFKHVRHDEGRRFVREIRSSPRATNTDVYVCSDARNQGIRQILADLSYVTILNTAGNVIYAPSERPTIVIAHGDSDYRGCGAVDYARENAGGGSHKFASIARLVSGHPIENAKAQLEKVAEEWRAGILYFNHGKGEITNIRDEKYHRTGVCEALYQELQDCLKGRYTTDEITGMSRGQDPHIIFLTNLSTQLTAFGIFRINLQRNEFDGIVRDTVAYAMEHALRGKGSFESTEVAVMAFRRNEDLPDELEGFLNGETFIRDYIRRGGRVYLMTVGDIPSAKTIWELKPKK
jgi:hypothetical protein